MFDKNFWKNIFKQFFFAFIFRYIYEKTNLSRALESCEHQRNYDDIQQKFKENVCNLLTIGKIMEFRREEVNRHQVSVKKKIRETEFPQYFLVI